ncbi:MAG: tRNA(Ile)-lysidine synthetase, partial [Mycoplasmataceae bacterium]|nr:tRNA(Ile)-lysidine synthetase [Mycoplasmataceae bacterium]
MYKYLAAVSGGPDSMYMLAKYAKQIKVVCHINYHLREESNNDQNIVKQYCLKNKIDFCCLNVTKSIYQKYQKLSNNKQTIYRLIRYDFFAKVAKKY